MRGVRCASDGMTCACMAYARHAHGTCTARGACGEVCRGLDHMHSMSEVAHTSGSRMVCTCGAARQARRGICTPAARCAEASTTCTA
eukprot:scaffold116775_cov63-Phaeocystis_antarctica.AAC.3